MPPTDARFAERYRALSSRDTRFDGQFIAGVHSTGVYCRPSCPAVTPLERNVEFYRTAAAAREAGLRACKRCLPDAVPGSPEWNLRDVEPGTLSLRLPARALRWPRPTALLRRSRSGGSERCRLRAHGTASARHRARERSAGRSARGVVHGTPRSTRRPQPLPRSLPSSRACPGSGSPAYSTRKRPSFRTLLGQQISVSAARTVLGRLTAELGEPGLFPTAMTIAEALASGALVLDIATPVEEFTARLLALPGIGPWTAGYLAMRVLGSPDLLLSSDLVMLQSAARLGLPATTTALAAHGARWAPWRSYGGLHLWRARPVARMRTIDA